MELFVEEEEDRGQELKPRIRRVPTELEPVAVDLDRAQIPDRSNGTGSCRSRSRPTGQTLCIATA